MGWQKIKKTLADEGSIKVGNANRYTEVVRCNEGYKVSVVHSFKNGIVQKRLIDTVHSLNNIKYLLVG